MIRTYPLLVSLEEYDPETKRATKTAIFDRRTLERYRPVERVETAPEALLVSLNETGQISWPRMESLTGRSASELQDELGPLVYRNPEGGAWETADRYLSGNVRAKLVVAQASEQIHPAYRRNVEALRAVQPKDWNRGEIEARLGSSWIPPSDIRDSRAADKRAWLALASFSARNKSSSACETFTSAKLTSTVDRRALWASALTWRSVRRRRSSVA